MFNAGDESEFNRLIEYLKPAFTHQKTAYWYSERPTKYYHGEILTVSGHPQVSLSLEISKQEYDRDKHRNFQDFQDFQD